MQINSRRNGHERFKPTKREANQLSAACDLAALVARNTDESEPLQEAALKATEGLERLVELLKIKVEAT